eukprot:Platyproteum_vivax@DN6679_c0_g1_i3.p1
MGGATSVEKRQQLFHSGEIAELPGGKCNYLLEGNEDADLIVMFHGISDFMGQFHDLAQGLREAGYRTLRFDWYGHGLSDMPRTLNYTVDMYIQQVVDLLEHLGLNTRPAIVLGYSLGGEVGLQYAVRYHELVSRLVLLAPAGLLPRHPFNKLAGFLLGPLGCLAIPLTSACVPMCVIPKGDFDNEESYVRFTTDKRSFPVFLRILRSVDLTNNEQYYATLSRLKLPTFFLWGALDNIVPAKEAISVLSRHLPGAAFRLYRNAGHQLLREHWPLVHSDVLDWLQADLCHHLKEKGVQYLGPHSMHLDKLQVVFDEVAEVSLSEGFGVASTGVAPVRSNSLTELLILKDAPLREEAQSV